MKKRLLSFVFVIAVCLLATATALANTIELPEHLTRIESQTFAGIDVEYIEFPPTVEFIADDAFSGASFVGTGAAGIYAHQWCINHGYKYVIASSPVEDFIWETISDLEAKVTGYIGKDSKVYIPSEIDGKRVIEIGERAFVDNDTIESVGFPSDLEVIGESAFENCSNLRRVDLPNSVITIDSYAFYGCSSLEVVNLSENLDSINESAFQRCTALKRIELPDSLYYLGFRAFRECTSLTYFGYPKNIQEVGGAFLSDCSSLTEVTVPEGVTKVMDFFLAYAGSVKTINLPSTLVEIGEYSFAYDNVFDTVVLPASVKIIGESAFENNIGLSSICLPSSLKEIGTKAFWGCSNLEAVSFNDKLDNIGILAFGGCSSLTAVQLPDSVATIGSGAFQNCCSLKTFQSSQNWDGVYVPGVFSDLAFEIGPGRIFEGCTQLTSIALPEGATTVPYMAFSYAPNLSSVYLPSTITKISHGAFMNASNLRTINFPVGITEIGYGAFKECGKLKAAALPDTVTTIGSEAFYGCSMLASFHYPRDWTQVTYPGLADSWNVAMFSPGNILGNTHSITSIEIPEGVNRIPVYAFQNCFGLKNVVIPNSVESIGECAFENCSALSKLYVSPNVTEIEEGCFDGCTALTLWCEYNSVALQHAIDHSIPYYYLSPDGINSPSGTLYEGESYGLHGYARASIPLINVTATIWNSDKTSKVQTISVNPSSIDYDLSETINYNMQFSKLPLGNYCYTLTAATELTEETWANTAFKVVEPPLRISIANFVPPSGIVDATTSDLIISGTISANYTMTEICVRILDAKGMTVAQKSVVPNAKRYSLVNLSLDVSGLSVGEYAVKITVSAKGETKTATRCALVIGNSSAVSPVTDELRQEIFEYVKNSKALQFGPGAEIDRYLGSMSWKDWIAMGLSDYTKITYSKIKDFLFGSDYDTYMVKKYEADICQLLDDLYSDGKFDDVSISYPVTDAIESFGKLAKGAASYKLEDAKRFLEKTIEENQEILSLSEIKNWKFIKGEFEKLDNAFDGIEYTEDFINLVCELMTDHSKDLAVLDVIEETYNGSGDPAFTVALNNIRSAYTSRYGKSLLDVFRKVEKELEKEVSKKVTGAILGKATGSLYGLVDTAAQILLDITGVKDTGENKVKFITQYSTLLSLSATYDNVRSEIFTDCISGILPTDEQISKLQITFKSARQALIRLYDTLKEIDPSNQAEYEALKTDVEQMTMPGVSAL